MADENEGIFALGRCYKQGIGTEEDWDKALEWFGKGAEKNESRCLTELGLAYENGNGVEENPQKGCGIYDTGSGTGLWLRPV